MEEGTAGEWDESVVITMEGSGRPTSDQVGSGGADDGSGQTEGIQTEAANPAPEEAVQEPDAVAAPPQPPVDIFAVMAAAGWELESDQDLADYLPVPPRSEGQVGRFMRAEETVSVARVTYPAPIFANPHEAWIRERMALLPDAHERVVRSAETVVHIIADSAIAADAVMALFAGDEQATDTEGNPAGAHTHE